MRRAWLACAAVASAARVPGSPYPSPPAGLNASRSLRVLPTAGLSPDALFAAGALQGAWARAAGGAPQMLRWDGSASASLWLNGTARAWGVALDGACGADLAGLLAAAARAPPPAAPLRGFLLVAGEDNSTNLGVAAAASARGAAAALVPLPASLAAAARAAGLAQAGDLRGSDLAAVLRDWGGAGAWAPRLTVLQLAAESACMSDFSIATGALQWWQDDVASPLAQSVWAALQPPFAMLGWGPDEYGTVTAVSQAGGAVVASNWASNLDTFSAFDLPAFAQRPPPPPPPPPPAARHTAAFLMSDGDNVQWLLDGMATDAKWWGSPDRGAVPLGWTLSPSVVDLAPVVAKHFYDSASPVDHLVAGVSGVGYFYPDSVASANALDALANLTAAYMAKADMRLVNVLGHGEGYSAAQILPYVLQPQIDAVFYYNYDNYAGLRGNITWLNDKPVIGGRFSLWGDGSNPSGPTFCNTTMLVDRLLALPRDPSSADGYSLIALHAWSHNVSDALAVATALAARAPGAVDIVTPAELVARVKRSVRR